MERAPQTKPLLEVRGLTMGFGQGKNITPVLDNVSLVLERNETVALLGESGCGKSVTAMSVMRLLRTPPAQYQSGEIILDGVDMLNANDKTLCSIRGDRVSMIFQEPMTSLNPVLTIEDQLSEAIRLHYTQDKALVRKRCIELLERVKIPSPEKRLKNYPNQFSGGMRQRIMIAMAIACQPQLLIADEPTTALDVTIQAQILRLMKQVQKESEMTILLITHDLGVVAEFAQRCIVMYAGQVVERATTKELFRNPKHPYTKGLLNSLPKSNDGDRLQTIEGVVPNAKNIPIGCRFHPRCPYATDQCRQIEPMEYECSPRHFTKCHLQGDL